MSRFWRYVVVLLALVGLAPAQQMPEVYGLGSELRSRVPVWSGSAVVPSVEPGQVRRVPPESMSYAMEYEMASDGTLFTLLHLRQEGAAGVRLHFENFHLPAHARLLVYGPDGRAHGPFLTAGPLHSGEFWTRAVAGPDVFIELQVAGAPLDALPFQFDALAVVEAAEAPAAEEPSVSDAGSWQVTSWRGLSLPLENHGGALLFEGDIVLPEEPAAPVASVGRNSIGVTFASSLWTGGTVPYTVDPLLPNVDRVIAAVQHWNSKLAGHVRLVPRTSEVNYVQFAYNSSAGLCFSQVGMTTGIQYVNLGDYCSAGNVIHEIGHTLGLWHEHTRSDRDSHIVVHTENIDSLYSYNFTMQTWNARPLGEYDYGSIMHYSAYSFSANGAPTIETIPAGIPIGQRTGLSAGDIAAVQALYPGTTATPGVPSVAATAVTVATVPFGQSIVVDGVSAIAPQSYSWTPGSSHTISAASSTLGAGARFVFSSWTNGGPLSQTIVTPASATTYTATYAAQYQISAAVSPAGAGSAVISPASADSFYAANTSLTVAATPVAGYCFSSWMGVAAPSGTARLTVDRNYALTANMAAWRLSIDRYGAAVSAIGGVGQVAINTSAGCSWNATTDVDWIVLRSPNNHTGPGALDYVVTPNSTGLWRFGAIRIGNNSFVVVQAN